MVEGKQLCICIGYEGSHLFVVFNGAPFALGVVAMVEEYKDGVE